MSVEFRPGAGQPPNQPADLPPSGEGVPADARVSDKRSRAPAGSDGVDAPRAQPAGAGAAESPRKAAGSRLGALARGLLKGAAVVGMAAALVVGGMFMSGKIADHQAPSTPVQIEAPRQVQDPALPGGQGPPASEIEAPGTNQGGPQGTEGRSPTLPTAPATNGAQGETPVQPRIMIDRDQLTPEPIQPRTFNPQTIRLDSARGE